MILLVISVVNILIIMHTCCEHCKHNENSSYSLSSFKHCGRSMLHFLVAVSYTHLSFRVYCLGCCNDLPGIFPRFDLYCQKKIQAFVNNNDFYLFNALNFYVCLAVSVKPFNLKVSLIIVIIVWLFIILKYTLTFMYTSECLMIRYCHYDRVKIGQLSYLFT